MKKILLKIINKDKSKETVTTIVNKEEDIIFYSMGTDFNTFEILVYAFDSNLIIDRFPDKTPIQEIENQIKLKYTFEYDRID